MDVSFKVKIAVLGSKLTSNDGSSTAGMFRFVSHQLPITSKESPTILVRLVSNKASLWKPRELDAYYGDCYTVVCC